MPRCWRRQLFLPRRAQPTWDVEIEYGVKRKELNALERQTQPSSTEPRPKASGGMFGDLFGAAAPKAPNPFGGELPNPFGEKKPPPKYDNPPPKDDPTLRDQSTWTAEDKKIVNDMASNWAGERKPNQEGYTFFQSPSPKTGDQGLDDFKIQPQALEIGWQVKVFGGISAVLLFALLVTLIVS